MTEENGEAIKPVAPAPEKKTGSNKTMTVVIIVIVVLAALGVTGYYGVRYLFHKAGEKVGEELVENALESSTGGNVDYDYDDDGATLESEDGTTSVGSKAEWPSDMPSSVPKYSSGEITYSSTTAESWYLMYENINSADLTSYKSALEEAGWEIVTTSNSTNSGESIQAENSSYELYIMAFVEGKSATLTVSKKE